MKYLKLLLIAAMLVGIAIAISLFTNSRSREYEAKYESCLDKVDLLEKKISVLQDSIDYYRTQLQKEKRELRRKSSEGISQDMALAIFERALPGLVRGEELERWVRDHRNVFMQMSIAHRTLINGVVYGFCDANGKTIPYSNTAKRRVFVQYEFLHRKGVIRRIDDLRLVADRMERLNRKKL